MLKPEAKGSNVVPLPASAQTKGPAKPGTAPALVPYATWQDAANRVTSALLGGERRMVVVGPPGTGKTLLLEHVARVLRAANWTVVVRQADTALPPIARTPFLLMIDEADRLPAANLAAMLRSAPFPIVLAGLAALGDALPGIAQVTLPPLDRDAARQYVAQWLALTGRTPDNLESAAVRRLVELSGGAPRLLATLLGGAAWLSESTDSPIITKAHVEEAAALRASFGPNPDGADQEPLPVAETDEPDDSSLAGPIASPIPPFQPPPGAVAPRAPALAVPAAEQETEPPVRPHRRFATAAYVLSLMLLAGAAGFLVARLYPGALRTGLQATGTTLAALQTALGDQIATMARRAQAPATPPATAPANPAAEPAPIAEPKPQPAPVAQFPAQPPTAAASPITPPTPQPQAPQPSAAESRPTEPPPPAAAPPQSTQTQSTQAQSTQAETAHAEPQPRPNTEAAAEPPTPPQSAPTSPPPSASAALEPPAAPTIAPTQVTPPPSAPEPPAASPAPKPAASEPLAPTTLALLLRRGREMLAIGDVSAARLLFGRAAEAGNAEAMLNLGRTYDPLVIAQDNLRIAPDPARAETWYRRAGENGNPDAASMLARLQSIKTP